ncbi:family 78 glycoside hydrolase catalytic domain [Kutzneria sp. NPDC052558]|uniref:family 78 glycoside hydrolase catalytic domain n=1 Tax=Kutzneria sp. NPDC052558 TaxID=3364121 RepID=UPI0037C8A1BA
MTELSRRTFLGGVATAVILPTVAGVASADGASPLRAVDLTTEHTVNPLGIDAARPRLGWRLTADGVGRRQSAYQIWAASSPDLLAAGRPDVMDTGQVASAAQTAVAWPGPQPVSRTRYHWMVRAWDENGLVGPWSDTAWFESALLSKQDWTADWIGSGIAVPAPLNLAAYEQAVPLQPGHTLGQSFTSSTGVASAAALVFVSSATAGCTVTIRRDGPAGAVLGQRAVTGLTGIARPTVDLDTVAPAGVFYLELSDVVGQLLWTGALSDVVPGGSAFTDGQPVAGDRSFAVLPPPPPANPLLRSEFDVTGPVVSARLYVVGLGYALGWINNQAVSAAVLSPSWTGYGQRVAYTTHDVTGQLRPGRNAIGFALGRGFFASRIPDAKDWYLTPGVAEPVLRAQLEIRYADGSRATVRSGTDWQVTEGPTTYDGVYAGESYDAQRAAALQGWTSAGFAATGWRAAAKAAAPSGQLWAQVGDVIGADAPVAPVKVYHPVAGVWVCDFGVTMSGWATVRTTAAAGTVIKAQYGEKLGADGRVFVGAAGSADNPSMVGRFQQDRYTARGGGQEEWTPSFTFKGFRYLEVSGVDTQPDVVAIPVHNQVASTMALDPGDPTYRQISDAFGRTVLNNLHSVPSDTPAYSKQGWTGDAHFASQGMLYGYGLAGLFDKWLEDIRLTQQANGLIGVVAPISGQPSFYTPTWTGLYPHLVRRYWLAYGDLSVPDRHFDAVRAHVDYLVANLSDGLANDSLADWMSPGHSTPPEGGQLVGTAYVIKALRDGSAVADALGETDQAARWRATEADLTTRFNTAFLDPAAGIYRTAVDVGYRQTSNAVPLAFGLVPVDHVGPVLGNLIADITNRGGHLNTGCAGTAALPYALSDNGRADVAHTLLRQRDYPSFGYWFDQGATTLWEQWEATARSHDHYFLGSPVQWLVERVLGVEVLEPGWARFRVAPRAFGAAPAASISLDTVRGPVRVAWRDDASFALDLEVPVNAVAEVTLPDGSTRELGSGTYHL